MYFYDSKVTATVKCFSPSARGNLDTTDVNRVYLEAGTLTRATIHKVEQRSIRRVLDFANAATSPQAHWIRPETARAR